MYVRMYMYFIYICEMGLSLSPMEKGIFNTRVEREEDTYIKCKMKSHKQTKIDLSLLN